MSFFTHQLARELKQPLGTILVIGAGGGSELPALRELGFTRLVLVEAQPRQAEALSRRIRPEHGEEVRSQATVAGSTQNVALHVMNNPAFSSARKPERLLEIFPNLHATDQIEVIARSLEASARDLGLDANHDHLLILDAPGQAADLLTGTAAAVLQGFTWVIVNDSVEPLYTGAAPFERAREALNSLGFDSHADDPDATYPMANLLARRNPLAVKITQLEARLHDQNEELIAQRGLFAKHKADAEALAQHRDELQNLANERRTHIQKLTQERDQNANQANQYKTELDKAGHDLAEQQKLDADRQAEIHRLAQECDQHTKQENRYKTELDNVNQSVVDGQAKAEAHKQELGTHISQLEHRLETAEESSAELRQELSTAKQTVTLSIKLQTLRESDLKDLQHRYKSVLDRCEAQHRLLMELNDKLGAASNYFHLLTKEDRFKSHLADLETRAKHMRIRQGKARDV